MKSRVGYYLASTQKQITLSGGKNYLSRNEQITSLDRGFPGGPAVKTPPPTESSTGSIPGQGTKIPPAACELQLQSPRARVLQLRHNAAK